MFDYPVILYQKMFYKYHLWDVNICVICKIIKIFVNVKIYLAEYRLRKLIVCKKIGRLETTFILVKV